MMPDTIESDALETRRSLSRPYSHPAATARACPTTNWNPKGCSARRLDLRLCPGPHLLRRLPGRPGEVHPEPNTNPDMNRWVVEDRRRGPEVRPIGFSPFPRRV